MYTKAKSESPSPTYPPLEHPQEGSMKDLTFSPPSKQNSIMSLTLDEFQSKSGKSFGSMNMDDFLNNLWNTIDGDQLSLPSDPNDQPIVDQTFTNQSSTSIPRQNSFSIPSPMCKKTVDEVWFEIHRDQPEQQQQQQNEQQQNYQDISKTRESLPNQQDLAGMTLEDFLVKAGVVQEASALECTHDNNIAKSYPNNDTFCFEDNNEVGRARARNIRSNVPNNGFSRYQMATKSNVSYREESRDLDDEDGSVVKSKKGKSSNGTTEEAIERRKRRMIKNRESASRSRARKQAYTVELELEITQLKEENENLKQTVEEIERKRKNEQQIVNMLYTTKAQKIAENAKTVKRSMSVQW